MKMVAYDLIAEALVDGVHLSLDCGKLKARGEGDAVERWIGQLKANRDTIIQALMVGPGNTARAVVLRDYPGAAIAEPLQQTPPFDTEAWEERAAIAEFDGGLTREEAEAWAWQEDAEREATAGNSQAVLRLSYIS